MIGRGKWRSFWASALCLVAVVTGCTQFPNAFPDCDGTGYVRLVDVDAIVNDPNLDEDEKMDALQALFCVGDDELPQYEDLFNALLSG